jgi:hypothetical protein
MYFLLRLRPSCEFGNHKGAVVLRTVIQVGLLSKKVVFVPPASSGLPADVVQSLTLSGQFLMFARPVAY